MNFNKGVDFEGGYFVFVEWDCMIMDKLIEVFVMC